MLMCDVIRYALDDIGSGSHVHISLSQNGKNVFSASDRSSRHGMSKIGEEFMAGVLHHLPSLLAFTAPIPNRYKLSPIRFIYLYALLESRLKYHVFVVMIVYNQIHGVGHTFAGVKKTERLLSELHVHLEFQMALSATLKLKHLMDVQIRIWHLLL